MWFQVDTHKFGMAHKGTSVVLYRHPELRQHQFTRITDWCGARGEREGRRWCSRRGPQAA